MAALKEQESLSASIRTITKNWEEIKKNGEMFRKEIEKEYFHTNPLRKELFLFKKYEETITDEVIRKRLFKHSTAVVNCMETLVAFLNGNEETKPILFVLGKQHKLLNVNEKMFLEMKDAICKVIKKHLDIDSYKAWNTVLQYILINYVFPGMRMIDPF